MACADPTSQQSSPERETYQNWTAAEDAALLAAIAEHGTSSWSVIEAALQRQGVARSKDKAKARLRRMHGQWTEKGLLATKEMSTHSSRGGAAASSTAGGTEAAPTSSATADRAPPPPHVKTERAPPPPPPPPPPDLSSVDGIYAMCPGTSPLPLGASQLARVVDLLGRRCVADGEACRAARTLVPLVRTLIGVRIATEEPSAKTGGSAFARSSSSASVGARIHFPVRFGFVAPSSSGGGRGGGGGQGGSTGVLDAATLASLGVELLVSFAAGVVQGAALLTTVHPTTRYARLGGFVVLQLLAVEPTVESTGVGSSLLDAACARATAIDPRGTLLVPATAKWWEGASKATWLRSVADVAEEVEPLRRMPCLFDLGKCTVLHWRCDAPRTGWHSKSAPLAPKNT